MDPTIAELVKIGGPAVLLSAILVKFLLDTVKRYQHTVDNHINANTAALNRLASAIDELTSHLKDRHNA